MGGIWCMPRIISSRDKEMFDVHKSEAKGNPYGKWLSSAHAKAYEKLGSPEAKEAATKAGVTGILSRSQMLKCTLPRME